MASLAFADRLPLGLLPRAVADLESSIDSGKLGALAPRAVVRSSYGVLRPCRLQQRRLPPAAVFDRRD